MSSQASKRSRTEVKKFQTLHPGYPGRHKSTPKRPSGSRKFDQAKESIITEHASSKPETTVKAAVLYIAMRQTVSTAEAGRQGFTNLAAFTGHLVRESMELELGEAASLDEMQRVEDGIDIAREALGADLRRITVISQSPTSTTDISHT